MITNNIWKIGIVVIIVLIILASGCIYFPTTGKNTFSDGNMSFNYSDDFYKVNYSVGNDSSSPMQAIGQLENGDHSNNMQLIRIGKNKSVTSPMEVRDIDISKLKNNSSCELISTTTETNPNGIVVEKITYKQEDPFFGTLRYNDMVFEINSAVYGISVYGTDSNNQQIINTANTVFQSIK